MIHHTDRPTVLIVDDDPANIRLLLQVLRSEYATAVAKDGRTALRIAQSDKQPDLILLDVMLPDINGYEVCQELKRNQATCHIPIIFVSGKDSQADEVRGFEAGAADYLTKPFHPVLVKARVHMHLEIKKYRDIKKHQQ